MRIALLLAVLLALAFSVVGQAPTKDAPVKWEALNGKNKEFVVFMPAGYQSTGRRSNSFAPRITLHNTQYRYINGVVLMMEYYEGEPKEIQKSLIYREKLTDVEPELFGDFAIKRFSKVTDKQSIKIHHIAIQDRLYVVRSYSDDENNPISVGFFQSIRLFETAKSIAPNTPQGSNDTPLPNLIEKVTPSDDTQVFLPKDVDREAIIIYSPRTSFPIRERRGLGEVSVKLKLLLSSTGKVTGVNVVSSSTNSTKLLERSFIEAAKKTIFIPAQKEGRLVATYMESGYMMVVGR